MEKRAVIYIRVSDPSQIDNNSLETQLKSCKSFAQTNDYEVVNVYRDEGKSAKHVYTRPALRDLMSFCTNKKNRINALIVYKFDRFSRDTNEGLIAISLLSKYGVDVLSATEVSEMNPMGKAIRTVLMAFGQLDNENKGQRVRDNMQEVFRKGLWPFKCPLGYKRQFKTKEENKGLVVVPDPNLAPIITNMFINASKGIYSKSQLARIMNSEGFGEYYKTKADHKIVLNTLSRSFYYGNNYSPKWKEYATGLQQPLTDELTWKKAYHYLILKRRNFHYHDESTYPLKGVLECEYCGHILTTSPSRGGKSVVFYYECRNKGCMKVRINASKAHDQFKDLLGQIQPTSRVIKLFEHMVFSEWDKNIAKSIAEVKKIESRINSYQDDLRNIPKAKADGIYTAEFAKSEADRIAQEISVLEIEKGDIRIDRYNSEIISNFTKHFLRNLNSLWNSLDLPKKQVFLQKVFEGQLTCGKDRKIRTIKLSPAFELIEVIKQENDNYVTPLEVESKFPE